MEMIVANPHLAHVDTRLHRPTVMPDACAEEGGRCPRDADQGRGPDCAIHPRAEPSSTAGMWLGLLSLALVAGAAAVVLMVTQ
jgi:hypothetical protein